MRWLHANTQINICFIEVTQKRKRANFYFDQDLMQKFNYQTTTKCNVEGDPPHRYVNTLGVKISIQEMHKSTDLFKKYPIAPLRHCYCAEAAVMFLFSVDLEVWTKLANRVRIMRIASKCAHDFDSDWQRINAISHGVTLIYILLSQIISYSDTKVPVRVVM